MFHSPEVGEPFDQLGRVVLVELDVGEEGLEDGRARIADPEEHELGLAEVHRRQRRRLVDAVVGTGSVGRVRVTVVETVAVTVVMMAVMVQVGRGRVAGQQRRMEQRGRWRAALTFRALGPGGGGSGGSSGGSGGEVGRIVGEQTRMVQQLRMGRMAGLLRRMAGRSGRLRSGESLAADRRSRRAGRWRRVGSAAVGGQADLQRREPRVGRWNRTVAVRFDRTALLG